jgi:hypothetical protein
MKYYIGINIFLVLGAVLAFSTSAGNIVIRNTDNSRYDRAHIKTYQIQGNSMRTLGFANGALIDVIPVDEVRVGDAIAFECYKEGCDGAYIKKVIQKYGNCFWLEGRDDIWIENGELKESLDSRTTYGWLCDDAIEIYGVAFLQSVQKISLQ